MRHLLVECATGGCPAAGRVNRVPVHLVALDVLAVPTLMCARCGAAPLVKEGLMPKITVHGGASNAHADEATDVPPPVEEPTVAEPAPTPEPEPEAEVAAPRKRQGRRAAA